MNFKMEKNKTSMVKRNKEKEKQENKTNIFFWQKANLKKKKTVPKLVKNNSARVGICPYSICGQDYMCYFSTKKKVVYIS